jgi:hypothetical protein
VTTSSGDLSALKIIVGVIVASLGLSSVILTGLFLLLREPSLSPVAQTQAEQSGGGLFGLLNRREVESSPSPTPVAKTTPTPIPSLPPIPAAKTLTGGIHAFQTFNNCGPAALSMTLSYYGISESQQTLGRELRPYQRSNGDNDDKSVTLQEVAAKAKEYNFLTYQRPAGTIEILEAFIANDIPIVARTWLKTDEDIGHFRVVKGYNKQNQTLIQDDSLQGKDKVYSYAEFRQLWAAFNYEFLALVPPEKKALAEQILGELSNERTAWEKALALAKSEQVQNPTGVFAPFNESVALYKLGEYQKSIEAYERVSARLPGRMLWYQLEPILSYYRLRKFDTVIAVSDKILQNQNRAYAELYELKGLIFDERGQTEAARAEYDLAKQYNQSSYWKVNLL